MRIEELAKCKGASRFGADDVVHLVNSYIDSSYNRMDNSGYHEARAEGYEELLDDIFNLAQQEDTQVVECSECIFSKVYALDSNEKPQRWCKIGDKAVNDNDYCSWGEK